MKTYLVILLLAIGCILLAWIAWKLTQLPHELRREVAASASVIISAIPAPADLSPVLDAISGISDLTVKHEFQANPGAASGHIANIEIIRKTTDGYAHVGWRAPGSADLTEALAHPELALRHPNGTIEGAM